MKRPKPNVDLIDVICPACNGTGFPTVRQAVQPGRKIYYPPCKRCFGKGRHTVEYYCKATVAEQFGCTECKGVLIAAALYTFIGAKNATGYSFTLMALAQFLSFLAAMLVAHWMVNEI